jgi:hypothetical protein
MQRGGLVRVRAHTREDPKRRRSTRKRFQSLDKLRSVISTGRSKLGRRLKRLRPVGSGFNVY